MESSDKPWATGEGNGKPLQYSCLENPMNSMKRQKDMTLKDELSDLHKNKTKKTSGPVNHVNTWSPGLGIWGPLAEHMVNMPTLPR